MHWSIETARLKFRNDIYLPLTKEIRKKGLNSDTFTIIANNCWGGMIYESYGIKKMSPTIGMFIMPKDYIRFLSNMEYYLKCPLVFINENESKWKNTLCKKSNWGTYLIARLEDIELHMLHYHNKEEAERKWYERVRRISYDRLLVKFNDQNGCELSDIYDFCKLNYNNKLVFVAKKNFVIDPCVVYIKQPYNNNTGIMASREPFGHSKYINVTSYINDLK